MIQTMLSAKRKKKSLLKDFQSSTFFISFSFRLFVSAVGLLHNWRGKAHTVRIVFRVAER